MKKIKNVSPISIYIAFTIILPMIMIFILRIGKVDNSNKEIIKGLLISYIPAIVSSYALIIVTRSERKQNNHMFNMQMERQNELDRLRIKPSVVVEIEFYDVKNINQFVFNVGVLKKEGDEELYNPAELRAFRSLNIRTLCNVARIQIDSVEVYFSDNVTRKVASHTSDVVFISQDTSYKVHIFQKDVLDDKVLLTGFKLEYSDTLGNKYLYVQQYSRLNDGNGHFMDRLIK